MSPWRGASADQQCTAWGGEGTGLSVVTIETDSVVTFSQHIPDADRVELVGAFNGWFEQVLPMERDENGVWSVDVQLPGGTYLFRYRVNGEHWRLDDAAHGECTAGDGARKSRVWIPPLRQDPDALAA